MAHKELGYDVLERLKNDLGHIADVDAPPVAERNLLFIIMTPKKTSTTSSKKPPRNLPLRLKQRPTL